MQEIAIAGFGTLRLEHLVLDFNGTMACDGQLVAGVEERLTMIANFLEIHVVTADTFGVVETALERLPCTVEVLSGADQDLAKARYVESLGSEATASIGNGRNDRLMLKEAALGIVVLSEEGTASEALLAADIVCPTIASALDLFLKPLRLRAVLRTA
ncbi:MAG: ATPase P [Candidatus Riflebacteria bacterium]|nr:ATPase P [Candidatus Riflebacteria bacterium]